MLLILTFLILMLTLPTLTDNLEKSTIPGYLELGLCIKTMVYNVRGCFTNWLLHICPTSLNKTAKHCEHALCMNYVNKDIA